VLLFLVEAKLTTVAYGIIIASVLGLSWQFYLLFYHLSIEYHFKMRHQKVKIIVKNSILLKLSGLLYGSKEPLFALIFLSLGEGFYSIFSYANKFATAIFQISSTPAINRFSTHIHHSVAQKEYQTIQRQIKTLLLQTVPLFLLSTLLFYLFIPYTMPFFFKEALTSEEIRSMQILFSYMSLLYFIIVLESPFAKTLSVFKIFNYQLFVNGIFFISICLIYLLYKSNLSLEYHSYLSIIILAQVLNLYLYQQKSKTYLKGKI
jgi:Na+-driven multidrug efflux pump